MVKTAEKMPVIVSMGDVAASGGYWITCGANTVMASPATITASIGVFGGHLAMSRFWEEKIGRHLGAARRRPNAAIYDSLDAWTPEQRKVVDRFLGRIYDAFLERVSTSRKLSRDEVDAVGRGRVFTGAQAIGKGLLDELGGSTRPSPRRASSPTSSRTPPSSCSSTRSGATSSRACSSAERDEGRRSWRGDQRGRRRARPPAGPVWLPPIVVR